MRILFVNAFFDPSRFDGERTHIEHLTKELTSLGFEIWGSKTRPLPHLKTLSANRGERIKQLLSMDIYYVRIAGKPPSLPKYMKQPWWNLGFRKPVVWEVNAASDFQVLKAGSNLMASKESLDQALRRQARHVSLAICNTNGLAEYARDLGVKLTKTVPLGADPELFTPTVPPAADVPQQAERLNIVWSGSADIPWHDLDLIHNTAEMMLDENSVRFYIIGPVPNGRRFPPNVIELGPKPYREMPAYLNAMDVGLAVYKEGTWSRYGVFSSPLKLFEYMATGLIVMASPIEQVRECIKDGENGYTVPYGDSAELARRLSYVAQKKGQLIAMRRRARQTVLDYSNWQRVASDTASVIQEVLSP